MLNHHLPLAGSAQPYKEGRILVSAPNTEDRRMRTLRVSRTLHQRACLYPLPSAAAPCPPALLGNEVECVIQLKGSALPGRPACRAVT